MRKSLSLYILSSIANRIISSNVDRLFAIWQALNPTSYAINQLDDHGTFTISANTVETTQTPLKPFNDSTGTKTWDSQGVRDTKTFAYAYPETQTWKSADVAKYRSSVQVAVQKLYGGISNEFLGQDTLAAMANGGANAALKSEAHDAQKPISEEPAPADDEELSRGGEDFEAEIAANGTQFPAYKSYLP